MNVKLYLNEIVRLIDNRVPVKAVYNQLAPLAEQARLGLPMPQAGAGYLQWPLPGNDWRPFSQALEEEKPVIAKLYKQRKEQLTAAYKTSPMMDAALTTPSEDFIYFRKNETDYDISLVAWGYRYPNQTPCKELNTWIKKEILQNVRIGFEWDGQLLENFLFYLDHFDRKTSADGWFDIKQPLPVGNEYVLKITSGTTFILKVEHGKEDYIFDVTQYAFVDITVQKDNVSLKGCTCEVIFNDRHYQLMTDEAGTASQRIPLVCTPLGELEQPQPVCQVTCQSERKEKVPYNDGDRLAFRFFFQTEKPEEPDKPKPDSPVETEPEKPEEENTEKEQDATPQFVELELLDYGGYPLVELDFILVTKKRGEVSLKTDANGICRVPQEWFTKKEKFKIKFSVSPEYQQIHDLHDVKSKKKYGKK